MTAIVILTGAGISAESGLDTFRGGGGLWAENRIEDVATPEAFLRDPSRVHGFYNARRAALKSVAPNAAHHALARLEAEHAGPVHIITQNVDDLHDRAGSQNLIHMHGELRNAWCTSCDARHPWQDDLSTDTPCPACNTQGQMRPDIVWFGEMPYAMEAIHDLLDACDLFAAIGTSGNVYPAADFLHHAASIGAQTLELNLEPSANARAFHGRTYGKATDIVPAWVEGILADASGPQADL